MPAHIIETSQLPIGSAHKQQRFASHFRCEVVSGLRELPAVSSDLPGSREDSCLLGSEYIRIGVKNGRQCPRILYLALDAKGIGSDFHD
jgi:hypothetical protein